MKIRNLLLACVFLTSSLAAIDPGKPQLLIPDFRTIAKKAIPAVVSIKVEATSKTKHNENNENPFFEDPFDSDFFQKFFGIPRRRGESSQTPISGQASGVIVSPDGIILTNAHVVNGFDNILVTLNDGREFKAEVVGQDENSDVAVIKINAKDLPYLNLANSDQIEVGEWVSAVGNPFGLQATLTTGVVSGKGRNGLDIVPFEDFIQTDAAINRGNSGGPLLDLNGDVIGINTAIATSSGGNMGVGFAIPSNIAKYIMNQLMASGSVTRGFLGVSLQKIDHNLAQAFNLSSVEGALIADVSKDSPAQKAGLQRGDIVLKYNKQSVLGIASLRNAISFMKPGSTIHLTILRDGKTIEVPVNVGTFPKDEDEVEESDSATSENTLGIEVQSVTPDIADNLNLGDEKGVVITKVSPNSPASFAGLKRGGLVVSVNREKVTTPEQFHRAVNDSEEGRPVLFLVKQNGSMYYVSIRID